MTNEEIAVKFGHHDDEINSLKHRVKKCEEQVDSEATDIETLKADFNALLLKLKNAGLM